MIGNGNAEIVLQLREHRSGEEPLHAAAVQGQALASSCATCLLNTIARRRSASPCCRHFSSPHRTGQLRRAALEIPEAPAELEPRTTADMPSSANGRTRPTIVYLPDALESH